MNLLKNERGSSSILVVLSFLMLGIFSVLGMMSSYSDYKLALKNATWNQQYDELQGEVYAFIAHTDAILIDYQNDDSEALKKQIQEMDDQIMMSDLLNGFFLVREFEGTSEKKIRLEIECLASSSERYNIKMIKEIPVIFNYPEEPQFIDMEATNND